MQNEELRNLNDVGERLRWVRTNLGLNSYDVATKAGIPVSNYYGREQGVRTYYIEEYLVIAEFFNQHWIEKFTEKFPEYNGTPIKKIHVLWVMFGIVGDL